MNKLLIISFFVSIISIESFSQTWNQKPNFPGVIRYGAIGEVVNGYGYVGSGFDGTNLLNDFWKFDPSNGTWTQLANMPGPKRRVGVSFLANGEIYFGHGWTGSTSLSDYHKYNPINNTWDTIPTFPFTTGRNVIGMELDNRGYVGGGTSGSAFQNDKLYEFDPFLNVWTLKSTYPFGGRSAQSGISYNGLLYIGMGRNTTDSFKDFWSYSPITDTWVQLQNFPGVKRINAIIFIQNDKIVVGSGYTLGTPVLLTDYYQFDPITGTWSPYTTPAFNGRSVSAILEFPGDDTYIVAGWDTFENETNQVWNYGMNVSIKTNTEPLNFKVYPNPGNGIIKIEFEKTIDFDYSIYSLHGELKLIGKLTGLQNTIDCSALLEGLYLINFHNENNSRTHKLIIDRN